MRVVAVSALKATATSEYVHSPRANNRSAYRHSSHATLATTRPLKTFQSKRVGHRRGPKHVAALSNNDQNRERILRKRDAKVSVFEISTSWSRSAPFTCWHEANSCQP
jgi:hypothetical protein